MGILDEEQEREGEQSTVMRSRLVALVGVIDWFYDALRDWSLFQALEG